MSHTAGGATFPGSIASSTTTKVTPLIWFDSTYFYTRHGNLKAAAVVIDLLAFILASVGWCGRCPSVTFFNVVAMFAFWITLILLAMYLFHVIEKIHSVPWMLAEFVYCGFWTALWFFSSITILTNGGVYAAAGFFGFGAFAIYGYDAYIKYQGYQAGEIAQGERSVQSPSSVA